MTDDTRPPTADAAGTDDPERETPESVEASTGAEAQEAAAADSDAAAADLVAEEPAGDAVSEAAASANETEEVAAEPQPAPAEPADVAVTEAEADEIEEPEAADVAPEPVSSPGVSAPIGDQRSDAFVWHPDHAGKTFDEVRQSLANDIAADQRQHRLAMDGAEESEQEALASVVSLERKWGPYDFDWAEQDPEVLAERITEFERERERRQSLLSWTDYRAEGADRGEAHDATERSAELSTSIKAVSLLLVVLLIVVILLAVWAL